MEYETLDDGSLLTDERGSRLVADAYTALERGAYKIIPNPQSGAKFRVSAPAALSVSLDEYYTKNLPRVDPAKNGGFAKKFSVWLPSIRFPKTIS